MPPVIRRATQADLFPMAQMHVRSWQAAYRGIIPDPVLDELTPKARAERYRKHFDALAEKGYFYFVLEANGCILGLLTTCPSFSPDRPDSGEIGAIYLDPDVWDRGYGKLLMDFGLQNLRERGFHHVILWVLEDNKRARRFYERNGFTLDGSRKPLDFGEPVMEVRYEQNL